MQLLSERASFCWAGMQGNEGESDVVTKVIER